MSPEAPWPESSSSDGQERDRLSTLLKREATQPFDLTTGPLFRPRLLRVSPREHVLSLVLHHIVTDGWSQDILVRELSTLYQAFSEGRENPLAELRVQYADWAAWQRAWLAGGELERQLAYWKDELRDIAPLELPTDRPRQTHRSLRGATVSWEIPDADAGRLQQTTREAGATLFHALLACFTALLARLAASEDVVVGTPVANRTAPEAESVVGFFANTLALRLRVPTDITFRQLVTSVRNQTLAAHAHQDVPFETVVDTISPPRTLSRNPLFDIMFVLQHAGPPVSSPGELTVESLAVETGATQFDLTLLAGESSSHVFGALEYDTELFHETTARRIVGQFLTMVRAMGQNPDVPVGSIDLSTSEERARIETTNETAVARPPRLLHRCFEETARRYPGRVAVQDEERALTYAGMDDEANRLAIRLRQHGVGAEVTVGLLGGRNVAALVGFLAVWKAGGVVVPLDPAQPKTRLATMIRDAGVRTIVCERSLEGALPDMPMRLVYLDESKGSAALLAHGTGSTVAPPQEPTPGNAAYVIFTSGSTGQPKGVMVEHFAITDRVLTNADHQHIRPGDRVFHFLTAVFDGSLEEFLPAWLGGATVVVHPDPRGDTPRDWVARCIREQITVGFLTVGLFHELADEVARHGLRLPPSLRLLLLGGESPNPAKVAAILAAGEGRVTITNIYGPTETVIASTRCNLSLVDAESGLAPIGVPVANARVYLLDRALRPIPIGAIGEIYIGGPILARGYVRRPAETAAAFVPDPFTGTPGARMYRTGDLAIRRDDGQLLFVGRSDAQIKLRGYRIELGEIESVLGSLSMVREAVVLHRNDAGGPCLAGYAVAPGSSGTEILRDLRNRLPEYMIPSTMTVLSELPRTATGKIDRLALPAPERSNDRGAKAAPRDEVERWLGRVWSDTLGLSEVDVEESFFEAGGNSLLAVRFVTALRHAAAEQPGTPEISVADLFRYPSIAALAQVTRSRSAGSDAWASDPANERSGATGVALNRPFASSAWPFDPLSFGTALVPLRAGSPEFSPLVFFHAVGGGVSDFASIVERTDSRRPVLAVQDLAGNAPADVPMAGESYARAIAHAIPDGPIHLVGWSYGGLLAFEVAQRLVESGRTIGALTLIDVAAPRADAEDVRRDSSGTGSHPERVHHTDTEVPESLSQREGEADADADAGADSHPQREGRDQDDAVIRQWQQGVAARVEAARRYRPRSYAGDVILVRGTESITGRDRDETLGWSQHVAGAVRVEWAPGSHESIVRGDGARVLAALLDHFTQ